MIVYHAYRKDSPIFYIGKTVHTLEHRRKQHENESRYKRGGSYFHKALAKYGIDSFEWRILERCDKITVSESIKIK